MGDTHTPCLVRYPAPSDFLIALKLFWESNKNKLLLKPSNFPLTLLLFSKSLSLQGLKELCVRGSYQVYWDNHVIKVTLMFVLDTNLNSCLTLKQNQTLGINRRVQFKNSRSSAKVLDTQEEKCLFINSEIIMIIMLYTGSHWKLQ